MASSSSTTPPPIKFSPKMARNCMYSLVKPNRLEVLMKGDNNVGIKSLLLRLIENRWTEEKKDDEVQQTMMQRIELEGHSSNVALSHKRFEEKNHCPWVKTRNNFAAVMFVYDVANAESFNNLWGWLVEIDKYVPNCTKFLVGNKSDLLSKVPFKRASDFATQAGMIFLGEVSAKTGQNAENIWKQITNYLVSQKFGLPLPKISAPEAPTIPSKPAKSSRYATLKRTFTSFRFSFNDKTSKTDYVNLPKVERTSIHDIF